jgi:hypothetical protein
VLANDRRTMAAGSGGARWQLRAVTAAGPGLADRGLSRKNRTHSNRRSLALDERRILCSHRRFGRRSTASVQAPHVCSGGK